MPWLIPKDWFDTYIQAMEDGCFWGLNDEGWILNFKSFCDLHNIILKGSFHYSILPRRKWNPWELKPRWWWTLWGEGKLIQYVYVRWWRSNVVVTREQWLWKWNDSTKKKKTFLEKGYVSGAILCIKISFYY